MTPDDAQDQEDDRLIAFIDLQAQRARLGDRIDAVIACVLVHGNFIMGPEVGALEGRLEAFCGVCHCVGGAMAPRRCKWR